jgi:aminoglycoside 3-N-acetyltransferase I
MAGEVVFRRLGPGDSGLFHALNAMFGAAFEDSESYGGAPPDDAYVEALLTKEHVIVMAALADGGVIGGLVAYELDKFEQSRRELYIYDLAVIEPYRRRGIASGLIRRLGELGKERGAWVMYVQADYGDEPAIALYTKLGRREDVMHFDIDVPE